MAEPLRHRQTKEAETDMFSLQDTASHPDSTHRFTYRSAASCPLLGDSRHGGCDADLVAVYEPLRLFGVLADGCGQLLMFWKGGNAILVDFLPELVPPAFREDEGSQAEDDLCALWGPAHSRATQPLFDQSFACGLCDA